MATLALMIARHAISLLVGLCVSLPAGADEGYIFHRITCEKIIGEFAMERVLYWNIRDIVWPDDSDWSSHVRSIRRLERESNLYVLHDSWGHYDKPALTFSCSGVRATITFIQLHRPAGPVGPNQPYRNDPRLTVTVGDREIISNLFLTRDPPIARARVYLSDGYPDMEICASRVCLRDIPGYRGGLDSEGILRLLYEHDR